MKTLQTTLYEGLFDELSTEQVDDIGNERQLSKILPSLVLPGYNKNEEVEFKVQGDTLIIILKTHFSNLNKSVQEALKPFGIKNIVYRISPSPKVSSCSVKIRTLKNMSVRVDKGEQVLLSLDKNPNLNTVNIETEFMDFGTRYAIKNTNIKNKFAAIMAGFGPNTQRKVSGSNIEIDYANYEGVYLFDGRWHTNIDVDTGRVNSEHDWDPTDLTPGIEPNVIVFPLQRDDKRLEAPYAVFRKERGGLFNGKYNLYFVRKEDFHKETHGVFKQYSMTAFYRGI